MSKNKNQVNSSIKLMKTDNKRVKIDDVENILKKDAYLKNLRRVIPPEKRMVRRTAEDFAAGAEPARGHSHQFIDMKLSVTPPMKTAIQESVDASGFKQSMWLRAAIRKALREGLDVEYELDTEIVLAPSPTQRTAPEIE